MVEVMHWPVVLRAATARDRPCPSAFLTLAPGFRHEALPDEVGLFLPTNAGPQRLIDGVAEGRISAEGPGPADGPVPADGLALGLFLASPFLNVSRAAAQLRRAGVSWVANIPGVEQQDPEFTQQLADVGLDRGRELDCLRQFRAEGLRAAVVVADAAGAAEALSADPEALLVLPRIADFAAGFPSLRQRGAAAQAVASAVREAGWSGLVLGLGDHREAEHERLWPDAVDGLICRPHLA